MKFITDAIRIKMFHSKEKEDLLDLEQKTELIKNRKYGIEHPCNSRERELLQAKIERNEAFVSLFETGSTVQTSMYDALVVCNNKEYYLIKWKK